MAQYKVPQDVEADDKLLGPFTFRQFVYLMIAGGCIGLTFALFQIFPLLAIIPIPFIIFFGALALPLRKDQPMETYLAAVISYHLKPKERIWIPGQRESTVLITAPKKSDEPNIRKISEEEAGKRLSFLANVIDTEGYSIRDELSTSAMHASFIAEAEAVPDVLDEYSSPVINQMIVQEQNARKNELMAQMRTAINNTAAATAPAPAVNPISVAPIPQAAPSTPTTSTTPSIQTAPIPTTPAIPTPAPATGGAMQFSSANIQQQNPFGTAPIIATAPPDPNRAQLESLAANTDYSIETIQKQAERLNKQ